MAQIKFIDGGVCAPQGFTANGIRVGIKESRKINDTALVYSEKPCNAAGVYTQNRVQSESVKLTKKHLADGRAQAAIEISGNANTCTGAQGAENALRMAKAAAGALGLKTEDVIVYSTGVIGAQFDVTKVENNIQTLKSGLSKEGHEQARVAIITTDTHYKECAVEFTVGGKTCRMGTMCKGSGMIHINMGTMLSFITTDCAISSKMLDKALHESILGTYNCVSVDGDTSTNDTLTIMANGMAGNKEITAEDEDYDIFLEALNKMNRVMAMKIAADGEGATKLIECNVNGAKSIEAARGLAKQIICSSLSKAAIFGADANFGRFLCAMGYSGIEFDPDKTSIWFTSKANAERYFDPAKDSTVHGEQVIQVFDNGVPCELDEDLAKKILSESAIEILVQCQDGKASGTAWGCDLTYDYVKINGDYRT